MRGNDLTGAIPSELGSLSRLQHLWLDDNDLTGAIPAELGDLPRLRWLLLSSNHLTGAIPPELGGLSNLTTLSLDGNDLTGAIPPELGNLSSLEYLYLHNNDLTGSIPPELANLLGLNGLRLSGNALTGTATLSAAPADVAWGTGATVVTVTAALDAGTAFAGGFSDTASTVTVTVAGSGADGAVGFTAAPSGFTISVPRGQASASGTFTVTPEDATEPENNETLTVSGTGSSGIAGVTALSVASASVTLRGNSCVNGTALADYADNAGLLADCGVLLATGDDLRGTASLNWDAALDIDDWDGVTISGGRVTRLSLTNSSLDGAIPAVLGDLSSLEYLDLSGNDLAGAIPPELANLSSLEELVLSGNDLTGTIPPELAGLSNLTTLNLSGNALTGTATLSAAPVDVAWGAGATVVTVTAALDEGTAFASGFSDTAATVTVTVAGSGAEGVVGFTAAPSGFTISVPAGQASASGTFTVTPEEATGPEDNETLTVSGAGSSGIAGVTLSAVPAVSVRLRGNACVNGAALADHADNAGLLADCGVLLVARDDLRGAGALNWDAALNIDDWDGVTISGGRVTGLPLSRRGLDGTIPAVLGDLSSLERLYLYNNNLTGSIPPELGDLSSLRYLILWNNQLTGTIPAELGDLTKLEHLDLFGNDLTGAIPSELGDLAKLEYLRLADNQLTGSIPLELGDLSNLGGLYLSYNDLTGTIPAELANLSNLEYLSLYGNDLTGTIPPELANLSNLKSLNLSGNDLTGTATLSAVPSEVAFGAGAASVTVTAALDAGTAFAGGFTSAATTVSVAVAGSGVEGAVGYTAAPSGFTISVPSGQASASGTFTVTPVEGEGTEGDETLAVSGTGSSRISGVTLSVSSSSVTLTLRPAAPAGVAASAGDGEVALSWTDPGDDTIDRYQHRVSGDGGATWSPDWTDMADSGADTTGHTVTDLANGTAYSFELRAVNEAGASAASARVAATPAAAVAAASAAPAVAAASLGSPAVALGSSAVSPARLSFGASGGSLSVDRSGSAVYTIPVAVPPGTAGMAPALSLSYASDGGDGLLGAGWSLDGLSWIARCPQTPAADGRRGAVSWDAEDRFCLDGERLVAVDGAYGGDGTEYRTAVESFSKIVSHGRAGSGPAWFEVRTGSGRLLEYGRTADSRIEAPGRSEARQWALNRIADASGNYLAVSYREAGGTGYPSRIDYAGHDSGLAPYASVRFAYGSRPDARVRHAGGSRWALAGRLTGIGTYNGSKPVSDYRISYSPAGRPEASRIASIVRCDALGNCRDPAVFAWNAAGAGRFAAVGPGAPARGDFGGRRTALSGDFDGDGVADIAWARHGASGLRVHAALGKGNGKFAPAMAGAPARGDFGGKRTALSGDFDGDGVADIAWARHGASGLRVDAALGQGGGKFAPAVASAPGRGDFGGRRRALSGDFDGDGIADIVWARHGASGLRVDAALGRGEGKFGPAVSSVPGREDFGGRRAVVAGDFNGDGASDLAWVQRHASGLGIDTALAGGGGTFAAAVRSAPKASGDFTGDEPLVGDFNGDGLDDLAWARVRASGLRIHAALSRGDGTFASAVRSAPASSGDFAGYEPLSGDFNGDGIADIAWAGASGSGLGVHAALGGADGTFASAVRSAPASSGSFAGYEPLVGDFDGDGTADIAWTRADGSGLYAAGALSEAPAGRGRLASVRSGSGPALAIAYAPLTDGAVHTRDTGADACALPCVDLRAPRLAVESVSRDYGGGLVHATAYRYGGAKADVAGRGFLGFRWIEASDGGTGAVTSTEYRQDFPYIGRVSARSRFLAGGAALSVEETVWSALSLNGGRTRFPHVSKSVSRSYEPGDGPGNEAVGTATETRSYDAYGNPTEVKTVASGAGGAFARTSANSYVNDASSWRLGRLACARTTWDAPGRKTQTRTSGFVYDAATGLAVKEAVEPGRGDVAGCVSKAAGAGMTLVVRHAYDRFGNRRKTTVEGPGIAARGTSATWGERAADWTVTANGRFPVATANALGHAEKRRHDGGHGAVTHLRGPNGLETVWEHDGFGRVVREARADGTETGRAYLACSDARVSCPAGAAQAVRVTATGSAVSVSYRDGRGLELRSETEGFDGRAVYRDTGYDALGRTVRRSRPYFAGAAALWTSFAYDALGRLTRETRPDGGWTEVSHEGLSGGGERRRSKVFPAGGAAADARTTVRETDALGRPVAVTDPLGHRTTYSYDALGNLLSVADAGGSRVELSYDLRGRMTGMVHPDLGSWSYGHDGLGMAVRQTDGKGRTATMSYDALGRMTGRKEAGSAAAWTYDTAVMGRGRLHRVSGPGGYRRVHTYDALGRPASETVTVAGESYTVSRTYDAAGRVATVAYPGGGLSVGRSYNARGYESRVYDAASPSTVYWRADRVDAAGRVEEAALGNGVGTTRTYDAATGLVSSIQSGMDGGSGVQDLGYAFDGLGNLATREDFIQGVYESFGHDGANRLTSAVVRSAADDGERASKRYGYDAAGNIATKSDVGAAAYVYGTGNAAGAGDAGPHAAVSAGGHTYAYDDNGNMVSGAGRTAVWTGFDRPGTIADAATSTSFQYGPDRGLVRRTRTQGAVTVATTYVGELFEAVAQTGAATRRVHHIFAGPERIAVYTDDGAPSSSPTLHYLHRDHLGSVDAVTDASGAVVERLSYDAFGKRRTASGDDAWTDPALAIAGSATARGFGGYAHLDEFGLVDMDGRLYDPVLGRFLSAAPFRFVRFPDAARDLNPYSYAGNNPVSPAGPPQARNAPRR